MFQESGKKKVRAVLEPKRIKFARRELLKRGYLSLIFNPQEKSFTFKRKNGQNVKYFPWTEYYNGKGLVPGHGFENLLIELKAAGEPWKN